MKRVTLCLVAGLTLVVAIAAGCAQWQQQQGYSASPAAASSQLVSTPTATFSFVYADATSVQFLSWSQTSTGVLTGMADELQDLSAGSPTFITSDLGWTGTRQGQQITITIPGATISATLTGTTLIRQQADPQTGQITNERWVVANIEDYNTLVRAFRTSIALGQDIKGIEFEIQTADQIPNPSIQAQVQSYLTDARHQLATLQALRMPHLPGLVTPWVIPSQQISRTLLAAKQFLTTPTPGVMSP